MRRLADGDTAAAVAGADHKDEVGAMARALQVFRDRAMGRERLTAAKEKFDAEQKQVVAIVGEHLAAIAQGGLSPGPERSSTVAGSSTRVAPGKRCSITAATRCAVVRSELRSPGFRLSAERKANGTSFSTTAPPAILAEVSTPRLILAACP